MNFKKKEKKTEKKLIKFIHGITNKKTTKHTYTIQMHEMSIV